MKGKHELRRMKAELQAAQSALAVEKDRTSSLLRMIQSMNNEIESLRGEIYQLPSISPEDFMQGVQRDSMARRRQSDELARQLQDIAKPTTADEGR